MIAYLPFEGNGKNYCGHAGEGEEGGAEEDQVPRTFIMDILEEAGPDIARRCFWDFGKWSDLWRVWRPVGSNRPSREALLTLPVRSITFQSMFNHCQMVSLLIVCCLKCMIGDVVALQDLMKRALLYDDSVRWGRCLAEVIKVASTMCPDSPRAAYTEIVTRLQVRMTSQPTSSSCIASGACNLQRIRRLVRCWLSLAGHDVQGQLRSDCAAGGCQRGYLEGGFEPYLCDGGLCLPASSCISPSPAAEPSRALPRNPAKSEVGWCRHLPANHLNITPNISLLCNNTCKAAFLYYVVLGRADHCYPLSLSRPLYVSCNQQNRFVRSGLGLSLCSRRQCYPWAAATLAASPSCWRSCKALGMTLALSAPRCCSSLLLLLMCVQRLDRAIATCCQTLPLFSSAAVS